MIRKTLLATALLLIGISTASAHYLWVYVDQNKGGKGATINLTFEEGPRPSDGRYQQPFVKRGKNWVQTLDSKKPIPTKLKEIIKGKQRWQAGPLTVKKPYSVTSYGKWGVYKYGKIFVLLHYNAQYVDVTDPAQLPELSAKHLKIHMIPKYKEGKIQVQVLFDGKPAAKRPVKIRGPKFRMNVTTNAEGIASFSPKAPGRHNLHTYVELNEGGKFEGKEYQKIRHHFTLTFSPPAAVGAE